MPPKKQLQVITTVENNADFERVVQFGDNLCVVDAYPKWCGPVKAVVPLFKRLKIDSGNDKLLNFVTACIDDILVLEPYKDTIPEPLFLFFSGGVLIDRLRGCDGPLLEKKIKSNLELEHKVQDSQNAENENDRIERKPISHLENEAYKRLSADPNTAVLPDSRLEATKPKPVLKEWTFGMIKPGAFEHMDEILSNLAENDITVKKRKDVTLSVEEASRLYSQHRNESHFEELIAYITSGESCLLLLESDQGSDLVIKFREIVGPFDVEAAKETYPDSLRAKYGTSAINNAIHAADSKEAAARELAFFFPDLESVESTIAILKGKILEENEEEILESIWEAGFVVAGKKSIKLNKNQIEAFYSDLAGEDGFDSMVKVLCEDTSVVLLLTSVNSVANWKERLGQFSTATNAEAEAETSIPAYGSTPNNKDRDVCMFFPESSEDISYGIIKPEQTSNAEDLIQYLKSNSDNLDIRLGKEVTLNDEVLDEIYGHHQDKDFYNDLKQHMLSNPAYCFLVTGKKALTELRAKVGPTDPEVAKIEAPESIRAKFGGDILKNGLHTPSDGNEKAKIYELFAMDEVINAGLNIVSE